MWLSVVVEKFKRAELTRVTVSLSRRSFIRSSILSTATALLAVSCNRPQANLTSASQQSGQPIRLELSLWPGAIPWQIAEDKGFLKASGVNTEITWFQTLADQLNAFTAGKIDIANLTLTDLFMSNVNNVPCKVISMPDVSAGADAIIADPSINSVQDFVGKTAAIEIATIGHLLFLQALAKNGVDPKSVQTRNMAADAATSALVAGKLPIAYSYEPFITQATKSGRGKVIFSSADIPGLIADMIVAQQKLLDTRATEVQKLVDVWHQVLDFRKTNTDEAIAIEAKRAGVSVEEQRALLEKIDWLTPQETLETFKPGNTTKSLVYAGEVVADFMLEQKLITTRPPATATLIDDRFIKDYISRNPA